MTKKKAAKKPAKKAAKAKVDVNSSQENRARLKESSAFWKPILAAPRWDWLVAAIVVVLLCLLAMCRPANGGEVRVDVDQRSGGVAVDWDSGRVDVGWGLGWWRPRPVVDPWRPWWQRPPQWQRGPQHRPGDPRRGLQRGRNDRGPRR